MKPIFSDSEINGVYTAVLKTTIGEVKICCKCFVDFNSEYMVEKKLLDKDAPQQPNYFLVYYPVQSFPYHRMNCERLTSNHHLPEIVAGTGKGNTDGQ